MKLEYSFTYLPCQTCHAKVKCDQCEGAILDRLLSIDGVAGGEVCIPKKLLRVESQGADLDEIDDVMDAIGVFLN